MPFDISGLVIDSQLIQRGSEMAEGFDDQGDQPEDKNAQRDILYAKPVNPIWFECDPECTDQDDGSVWRKPFWRDVSGDPCPDFCDDGKLVRS